MDRLELENIGPIARARIEFGDLTLFVGPQASGKSIALQWLKLAIDRGRIQSDLVEYGMDWNRDPGNFAELYFGEGLRSLSPDGKSSVRWNGHPLKLTDIARRMGRDKTESLFLIPAQRVLSLRDGWPRPFGDYAAGDPYVVRAFSEKLRWIMEQEFKVGDPVFPKANRLKSEFRKMMSDSVFSGFSLQIAREKSQKRLVLKHGGGAELPFMVWSAGQREFVPLLLGLYWLMPPAGVSRRNQISGVIIEEPEMGLHPRAISVTLMLVLELLSRGYKVCVSTHSTQILELGWVLSTLHAHRGTAEQLLHAMGAPLGLKKVATAALKAKVRAYYFENGKEVVDISSLDPDSAEVIQANWGGLVEPSLRANEIVAQVMANATRRGRN